jgi:hypothetical protein
MTLAAIIVIVLLGATAKLVIERLTFMAARNYLKSWPELHEAWLGNGRWVAFSRRFGLAYAIACIAGAFIWMLAADRFVPDTEAGAWFLFGPSMALIVIGVVLGMLYVARRVAEP